MEFIIEALEESLHALPLLFIICLIIEFAQSKNLTNKILKINKFGPLIGSILGIFPQCGVSVISVRLYSMKYITMGTLLSILITTSDEALVILMLYPSLLKMILLLIGLKLIVGIIVGYFVDMRSKFDYEYLQIDDCDCGCTENVFKAAIKHTIQIFIFILVTNIVFSLVVGIIGEEALMAMLNNSIYLQPIIAGLIGFIPNCAGSVVLAQLYVSGGLTFGALLAGLITSSGVGTLALIKYIPNKKEVLKIIGILYFVAIVVGYLLIIVGG